MTEWNHRKHKRCSSIRKTTVECILHSEVNEHQDEFKRRSYHKLIQTYVNLSLSQMLQAGRTTAATKIQ